MSMRMAIVTLALLWAGQSRADEGGGQTMAVDVHQLLSADVNSAGQPNVFPRGDGHVTAALYEISPGATLPVHKHPFPRMGYVIEGELRVTSKETGKSETYGRGSFVLESVDQWHEGTNPGSTPLRLLVIDLLEKGAKSTILQR